MSNIIVYTKDPDLSSRLEGHAKRLNLGMRSVSLESRLSEWLQMQSFDALLIDAREPVSDLEALMKLGWEKNRLMWGCVFDLDGNYQCPWNVRLSGIEVVAGDDVEGRVVAGLEKIADSSRVNSSRGVVIVEDLDSPRFIISTLVESLGYSPVVGRSSAEEAFTYLKDNPESVFAVITDLSMPEYTGADLIEWMRKEPTLLHLPVLVLTAYSTSDNLLTTLSKGATGFLVKPPKKSDLKSELEKAMRIFVNRQDPRLCAEMEVELLQEYFDRSGI